LKQPLIVFLVLFGSASALAQPQAGRVEPARTDSAYGTHKAWQDPKQRPWREANEAVAASGAGHQHGSAPAPAPAPAASSAASTATSPATTAQATPAAPGHDHGDMKAQKEKMKAAMKDGMKGDMKGHMKGDMKAHHEAMQQRMQSRHGGGSPAAPATPPAQAGKSDGAHKH
jgi:hypothetical protein